MTKLLLTVVALLFLMTFTVPTMATSIESGLYASGVASYGLEALPYNALNGIPTRSIQESQQVPGIFIQYHYAF